MSSEKFSPFSKRTESWSAEANPLSSKLSQVRASGQKILDLGAAPGSWAQYCSQKIGPSGLIIGLDLASISLTLPNAIFLEADITQTDLKSLLAEHLKENDPKFDVVLSDMAPKTTGVRIRDQALSYALAQLAFETACTYLRPGGLFVCKIFQSEDFEQFRNDVKNKFREIKILKPESTRKASKEIFVIGLKKVQ